MDILQPVHWEGSILTELYSYWEHFYEKFWELLKQFALGVFLVKNMLLRSAMFFSFLELNYLRKKNQEWKNMKIKIKHCSSPKYKYF